MPDLPAILARAALISPVTADLSPESLFLLLDLLDEAEDRGRWSEMDDTDWDDAQTIIAQASAELDEAT